MWYVQPAKATISLRIYAVRSEPLLVAWIFYDYTRDVRNELRIVLYLDIHVGPDKNNIYLSRFVQGLHNGV